MKIIIMKNIAITSVLVFVLNGTNLFSQNDIKIKPIEMQANIRCAAISTKELTATRKTKTTHLQKHAGIMPYSGSVLSAERKSRAVPNSINVKTFPNPFTTDLSVSINDVSMVISGYEAVLYDLQGRKVFSQELSSKLSNLNLSGIVAGMYVLHIQKNGHTILQEKVVKQ